MQVGFTSSIHAQGNTDAAENQTILLDVSQYASGIHYLRVTYMDGTEEYLKLTVTK